MIDYQASTWTLVSTRGSVVPKAFLFALPSAIIALIVLIIDDYDPTFLEKSGISELDESWMWPAMTAIIAFLLSFRTRQALGRFWEGTGLLHQMRGEWFDASSCLMTFSRDAKERGGKVKEVMEFRHTLLRLMSLMHASALDEISATDENRYEVVDINGLDQETLQFLYSCKQSGFNRVEALQHMIQVLVTHNHHHGIITIPPPILSRIYQTLSRGLVNLLNARKIKDTMFPFPYAQAIMILLFMQSLFCPLMITQRVNTKLLAMMISFVPTFGLFTLNFVAIELEMPFGLDDNDLPLRHFQQEMNATLLMLIHDMADHLPHTSAKAVKDFPALEKYVIAPEECVDEFGVGSYSTAFMHEEFLGGVFRECTTMEHGGCGIGAASRGGSQFSGGPRKSVFQAGPKKKGKDCEPEIPIKVGISVPSKRPGSQVSDLDTPSHADGIAKQLSPSENGTPSGVSKLLDDVIQLPEEKKNPLGVSGVSTAPTPHGTEPHDASWTPPPPLSTPTASSPEGKPSSLLLDSSDAGQLLAPPSPLGALGPDSPPSPPSTLPQRLQQPNQPGQPDHEELKGEPPERHGSKSDCSGQSLSRGIKEPDGHGSPSSSRAIELASSKDPTHPTALS